MNQWIFTLDVLNESDVAETLYFSDAAYIDSAKNEYKIRIANPALVTVSPNDGGVLGIFESASVGDIELENIDGGLDFLATYAVDGRAAVLSYVNETTVTEYYRGVVTKMAESGGRITLSLRAPHEVLNENFPMDIYAGTNTGYTGLEGSEGDIKGSPKTQVFGICLNIPATLVNAALQIYQVSSRADCVITAVYDEGVRLVNYAVNGAHSIGATSIAVEGGIGDIPTGAQIIFANHSTIYTVATGLAGGNIVLSSGLIVAVSDNTPIEQVNFYSDTTTLQATDYRVNAAHAAGATTVAVYDGVGAIATNSLVIFSNQQAIYTVATGLSSGNIVLSSGLIEKLNGDEFVQVIGASPTLWGSYQGYFRLSMSPLGAVTCDALSINSESVRRKAGDVFSDVATAAGLNVDSASVTELNAAGTIGLYVDSQTSISDLLDRIVRSVGGYYHIAGGVLFGNLLKTPASTAVFTIENYQINRIERQATGLGSNGLPIKAVHALYDRIETTQTSLAGGVGAAYRERLKKQYREITTTDSATATRHPLALTLEIESLLHLLDAINTLITRLLNVCKVRRDVVTIEATFTEVPAFLIGDTIKVITPKLGYSSGRKMVVIGYSIDNKAKTMTLRVYG